MRNSITKRSVWTAAGLVVLLGSPLLQAANLYTVTISTTPISGTSGYLAFDLVGGIPLQNNVAIISSFSSNATLGTTTPSGDVSGSLVPGPLTLTADQFFNEWLQAATFGTSISFQLSVTTNYTGTTPDAFEFFLLDSTQIPLGTTDPSSADSIFTINLIPGTTPQVFTSTNAPAQFTATVTPATTSATPEVSPAGVVALGVSLMLVLWFRQKRRRLT